jgi:lipopolysaccharide heptosyltransferase II
MKRLVILAPNWLGDAVMALPAIADVRRRAKKAVIAVAARPAVAPIFRLVPEVDDVLTIERRRWHDLGTELRGGAFDTALLLPNSLHAAITVFRAGIRERWGYRTDWRGRLLTRAVQPPAGLHQAEYYQRLVHALGFRNGPPEPRLTVPKTARDAANHLLASAGWDARSPLVVLAPGAAYGGAKRWPPERFAALAADLAADGVRAAIVGSGGDRRTADDVKAREPRVIDLVGRTDLSQLAGVLAAARALVTNDSGAMHLAAAIGTPVTAVFGPTDERVTRPLGGGHTVVTANVWCRPCMLRECPLDHRCMDAIDTAQVVAATRRAL